MILHPTSPAAQILEVIPRTIPVLPFTLSLPHRLFGDNLLDNAGHRMSSILPPGLPFLSLWEQCFVLSALASFALRRRWAIRGYMS